jgi:hypothetical protein
METIQDTAPATNSINHDARLPRYRVNWTAVFAGTITAIAVHILVSSLGVATGLGTFSPTSDENPATNFTIGSAITWTICAGRIAVKRFLPAKDVFLLVAILRYALRHSAPRTANAGPRPRRR